MPTALPEFSEQAFDSAILDQQVVHDDQLKCGESKNRRPDPGLDHR